MARSIPLAQVPQTTILVLENDQQVFENIRQATIPMLQPDPSKFAWKQVSTMQELRDTVAEMKSRSHPITAVVIGMPKELVGVQDGFELVVLARDLHKLDKKLPMLALTDDDHIRVPLRRVGVRQVIARKDLHMLGAAIEAALPGRGRTP